MSLFRKHSSMHLFYLSVKHEILNDITNLSIAKKNWLY